MVGITKFAKIYDTAEEAAKEMAKGNYIIFAAGYPSDRAFYYWDILEDKFNIKMAMSGVDDGDAGGVTEFSGCLFHQRGLRRKPRLRRGRMLYRGMRGC